MSEETKLPATPAVASTDWLGGPVCAECGGTPHTLGECPACHNTEEAASEMKRLNRLLKPAIHALDRIACDWDHMKRKDMVQIASAALCEIGVWRKVNKGEFARHGVAYPPNAAHQWRRGTGAHTATKARSRRPLHALGSAF